MSGKLLFLITTILLITGTVSLFLYLNKTEQKEEKCQKLTWHINLTEQDAEKSEKEEVDPDYNYITVYIKEEEKHKICKGQKTTVESPDHKIYQGKTIYVSQVTEPVPAFKDLSYDKLYMSRQVKIELNTHEYYNDKNSGILLTKEIVTE